MMRPIALAASLLCLSSLAHARGDFDFQFAGTGGMGTYNPTSTPAAGSGPIIKYTASGQPYLSGGKAITLPGAKNPITLALNSPITKAAAGATAARFAAAMTPLGAFMTVSSLAMMLADEYRDMKKTDTGWSAEKKTTSGSSSCVGPSVVQKCWDSRFGEYATDTTGLCHLSSVLPPDMSAPMVCKQYGIVDTAKAADWAPTFLTNDQLADAIAKQSGWPTSETLADSLAHPQVDFQTGSKPQVSGDPTVEGEPTTETKTNPDGSTTTTTRTPTITISYTGPTVTTTTTTVTTTTNTAPDGTTTATTTDTKTTTNQEPKPIEESAPGLCDLFPNILACKKLDPPDEGVIPKRDQDITLQTGPSFSGGSCPPDVVVSVGGQQVTVLSTAQPCGWIESYMKPIILLLASISAVFIVLPRGGD